MIRWRDLLRRDVSGYTSPRRRAASLPLKSRMISAFVHLFLRVSGETTVHSVWNAHPSPVASTIWKTLPTGGSSRVIWRWKLASENHLQSNDLS